MRAKETSALVLVELAVVAAVLVLILSIAIPTLVLKTEALKSQARAVAGFVRAVNDEVSFRKRMLRIRFIKDEGELILDECVLKDESICEWIETGKVLKLKGVKLGRIIVAGEETFGGEVEVVFIPTNPSPPLEVEVKRDENSLFVFLNPFTHLIEISEEPFFER